MQVKWIKLEASADAEGLAALYSELIFKLAEDLEGLRQESKEQ